MSRNKRLLKWLNAQQMKPGNGGESTRTPEHGSLSPQVSNINTPSKNTFHRSCSTLTLDRFINVLLSGNLLYLIIEGEPSEKDLIDAWNRIADEYSELINSDKNLNTFETYKKLESVKFKLFYITITLDYLKHEYDQELAETLAEMGYHFIQLVPDRKDYLGQIFKVETEAKYLIVLLPQYINEYNILMKDQDVEVGVKRTVMDYEKELMILSKFQGYRIRKEQTTVTEYAAIVNNYMEFYKKMDYNAQQ